MNNLIEKKKSYEKIEYWVNLIINNISTSVDKITMLGFPI